MLRFALHSLARGLVHRTWAVALITVVVCASFAAHALAALDAADSPIEILRGHDRPASLPPPPTRAPAASRAAPDGSGFVARNVFCSTCEPGPAGPGPTDASFTGRAAVLISTTTGTEPRATVRVPETEVQGSWGLGDRIPGVGTIARIGGVSIDVEDGAGRRTTLSLLAAVAAGPGPGAATPAPAPAAGPFADRIRPLGESTYEVDRDLVRELVSGAAKPGKVKMLPIVEDGDVKGVRVLGVRAGSLPAAIGMKNADVIDAIDGQPIKSAQQLLDLYAKLDNLSSVELQGTRRGKPLAITLRLR